MLHVLLILLKILGILLLVLLGLVLLVLFSPIRYSFSLQKPEEGDPIFSGKVTWLFPVFSGKASFAGTLDYRVRLFGVRLLGNQEDFLRKKAARQAKKEARAKKKQEREKEKASGEKAKEEEKKEAAGSAPTKTEPPRGKPKEMIELSPAVSETEKEEAVEENSEHSERDKKTDVKEEKTQKESFFHKLKEKKAQLSKFLERLSEYPCRELLATGERLLRKLLAHVLPRKLRGQVTYGFADPAQTGKVTGAVAAFYGLYGEHFSICPDFERQVFSADCAGRGRVRLAFILWLVLEALRDKNVRELIKILI